MAEVNFSDPVKKLKLLIMEANNKKVKLTTTQEKVILPVFTVTLICTYFYFLRIN